MCDDFDSPEQLFAAPTPPARIKEKTVRSHEKTPGRLSHAHNNSQLLTGCPTSLSSSEEEQLRHNLFDRTVGLISAAENAA